MSRRKRATKREISPDWKYNSVLVAKFINSLLKKGKKSVAEKIFYDMIDEVAKNTGEDGLEVFERAINNVKPLLEVKPRRIGGATYQVPMEVSPDRKLTLAIRWILTAAKNRNERGMMKKLAGEIIAASKKEGAAFKKREDTHRMAEANKAFAHFRV
ncbi:MAG TPA: 30S ribosomal protein S7 [Firmicutes bacterium]|jgi:small subunit ribosomal protein S7|uniref:Small ribosomal subunit protein uS7 n=1 Tax=candidate division TA06 bacterium TaxID=2250710 RepID=A0A660S7J2_UNCT6|nr:30S ribosomal protein S7 [candidate division WOR-3 bacterium]RKX65964.1 MAG: 30S ribosomal protein S7 [candidate division TA06 bacterium]HFD04883.1 30S ribosomal protein S7 [Bacillota bacterium]